MQLGKHRLVKQLTRESIIKYFKAGRPKFKMLDLGWRKSLQHKRNKMPDEREWNLANKIAAVGAAVGVIALLIQLHSVVFDDKAESTTVGLSDTQFQLLLDSRSDQDRAEYEERLNQATETFRRLIDNVPNDENLSNAINAFNEGDFSQTIEYRKQVAASQESELKKAEENQAALANLYFLESDYQSALSNYKKARQYSEFGDSYHRKIASMAMRIGLFDEAEQTLRHAAETVQNTMEIGAIGVYATRWIDLVEFYLGLGKTEEAGKIIEKITLVLEEYDYLDILDVAKGKYDAQAGVETNSLNERLAFIEDVYGEYSIAIIGPANEKAQLLDRQGNHEEAALLYERALEVIKSNSDEIDPFQNSIININYAFNQFSLLQPENTEVYIDEAIEGFGIANPFTKNIVPQVIQNYLNFEMYLEAKKYLILQLDILKIDAEGNAEKIQNVENTLEQVNARL